MEEKTIKERRKRKKVGEKGGNKCIHLSTIHFLLFFNERKTGGVTRLMLLSDLKGKIICIKEKDMVVITGLFKPAWRAVLLL